MVNLKFQKGGQGCCQKCGREFPELYEAILSQGVNSKSFFLCKDCAVNVKNKIDKMNAAEDENSIPAETVKSDIAPKEKVYEDIYSSKTYEPQNEEHSENYNSYDNSASGKNNEYGYYENAVNNEQNEEADGDAQNSETKNIKYYIQFAVDKIKEIKISKGIIKWAVAAIAAIAVLGVFIGIVKTISSGNPAEPIEALNDVYVYVYENQDNFDADEFRECFLEYYYKSCGNLFDEDVDVFRLSLYFSDDSEMESMFYPIVENLSGKPSLDVIEKTAIEKEEIEEYEENINETAENSLANETELSESDFEELASELNISLSDAKSVFASSRSNMKILSKCKITKGYRITVKINNFEESYENTYTVFKMNGKWVDYENIWELYYQCNGYLTINS